MAIGAEPFAAGFLTVMREALLRQPAFEESARIDARRRVRLEIHEVVAAKEMVEAHLEEIGGGGIARDMAAELGGCPVGAYHHGKRVPADDRRNAALDFEISRELRLLGEPDRILVRRVQH